MTVNELKPSDGLEALRWTGGSRDEDLDGLRQKPFDGLKAELGVGRSWELGTWRGGSATAV